MTRTAKTPKSQHRAEVQTPPPSAPRTREELTRTTRAQRLREPAAAPAQADAEAGAQVAPERSAPPEDPVETARRETSLSPSDVRAGPGDAGAADSPDKSTYLVKNARSRSAVAAFWTIIAVGIIAAIGLALLR